MPTPLLLIFGYLVSVAESIPCVQKANNRCAATCVDNQVNYTLDISAIVSYPHHVSVDSKSPDADTVSSFIFDCRGIDYSCGLDQPTSVCMTDTNSQQFSCGSAEITEWQLIATEPKYLFTVLYRGGACTGASCKQSKFNFIQTSENDVSVDFIRYDLQGTTEVYVFDVSGPCVGQANCKLHSSHKSVAGYVGLSLIVLVFLTVVGYFAIGSVVMYFHRGARGREIIPHVNFWMSIPVLVKDGCLFITKPCLQKSSSYSRL